MLRKIKRLLLTQYIGVIVIGLLAAQGIQQLISLILLPLNWQLIRLGARTRSVFGGTDPAMSFRWDTLTSSTVRAVLYLAVAWLLFRWLYEKDVAAGEHVPAEDA